MQAPHLAHMLPPVVSYGQTPSTGTVSYMVLCREDMANRPFVKVILTENDVPGARFTYDEIYNVILKNNSRDG